MTIRVTVESEKYSPTTTAYMSALRYIGNSLVSLSLDYCGEEIGTEADMINGSYSVTVDFPGVILASRYRTVVCELYPNWNVVQVVEIKE